MGRLAVVGLSLLVAAAAAVGIRAYLRRPVPPPPATLPTSHPATTTTTSPTSAPTSQKSIATYQDFITDTDARFAKTQPLTTAVGLSSAAGFILSTPVYLDLRGDLWITHPDAPPIAATLPKAGKAQEHLTSDEVVFVYWVRDTRGNFVAEPITRSRRSFTWHTPAGPHVLARNDYRFDAALLLLDNRIVVPTTEGVVAITPPPQPEAPLPSGVRPRPTSATAQPTSTASPFPAEAFVALSGKTPVTLTPLADGALAFRPWDNGDVGSETIARLGRAGPWSNLPPNTFPPRPIASFALTDTSILSLSFSDDGGVSIEVVPPLDPAPIDEKNVEALIDQLSDTKVSVRGQAQADLARFGPSAWPILERLRESQTAEAQHVIDKLLGARAKPGLGIFTILPGPVRVARRTPDGAIALYCFGGVSWLEDREEKLRSPALLVARPAQRVELVHDCVVTDQDPEDLEVQIHYRELMTVDPIAGLKRLMGNHLEPMLRPEHRGFTNWLGIDRQGRWLFRNDTIARTLILDPNYPDPKPELPAWKLEITDGQTGWDAENYPIIKKGTAPWRLEEGGWRPVDEQKLPMLTEMTEAAPTTQGTSLLKLKDGRTASGGLTSLVISSPKDPSVTIPLAAANTGESPVTLLQSASGHLFLFNRPGRVLRFSPDDKGGYTLDATFTRDIPTSDIRRIWLDPFDRICIAHDTTLTILFPDGRVPQSLANLARISSPQ